jgi:putative transcriptional regulator
LRHYYTNGARLLDNFFVDYCDVLCYADTKIDMEGWMRSRIREFRKQHGMTQQALADAVGCMRSALSEWETGTRRVPQWHLWALARCLHVTVDELYDCDDDDTPPPPTPRAAVHALPPRRRASRAKY